jgi:hypothetical protein
VVNFTSRPLHLQGKTLVFIEKDPAWDPEAVFTFEWKNILSLKGFEPRTVPPVA